MDKKEEQKKENQKEETKTVTLQEAEYLKLKEEAEKGKEYWDKILRMQAEFENIRKRIEKEKQDYIKFANEGIILELLNILDDLERVVELAEEKRKVEPSNQEHGLSAFLKGVEMILAHLYEMLKEYGVRPIEAEGKIFDPRYHEALMQVENNNVAEHTVLEELQKGYMLNDKVIRTSKVKVSKKDTV